MKRMFAALLILLLSLQCVAALAEDTNNYIMSQYLSEIDMTREEWMEIGFSRGVFAVLAILEINEEEPGRYGTEWLTEYEPLIGIPNEGDGMACLFCDGENGLLFLYSPDVGLIGYSTIELSGALMDTMMGFLCSEYEKIEFSDIADAAEILNSLLED